MFSSEKDIVEYHENLVSKIDIIQESRMLNYRNYRDQETDNKDRNTMISKIKEIEQFNLEQFKSHSKNYQFCYVIQNKLVKCSLTGNIRRTAVSLMITNFIVEDELIQRIRKNVRNINLGCKYQFLANLLDSNTNLVKDFSRKNFVMKNLTLIVDSLFKSDFDFISNFIDIDKLESFKLKSKHYENNQNNQVELQFRNDYESCFDTLKNITHLQIFHFIPTITENMFKNLNSLQKLILSGCHIEKLENGAFNGLHNLIELDLSKNCLIYINVSAFSDLKNLSYLRFDSNPFLAQSLDTAKSKDKFLTNNYSLANYESINYLDTKKKCLFDFGVINSFYQSLKEVEKLDKIVKGKDKMLIINEICRTHLTNFDILGKILPKFINLRFLNAPYVKSFENFNFEYLEFLILDQIGKVPAFCSSFQRLKALKIQDVTDFEIDCFKNLSSLDALIIRANNSTILENITSNTFKELTESGKKKINYLCMSIDIVDDQSIDYDSKINIFNSLFYSSVNKIQRQFSSFNPKRCTILEIFDFIDSEVITANFRLLDSIVFEYYNITFINKYIPQIMDDIHKFWTQMQKIFKKLIYIDQNLTFYSENDLFNDLCSLYAEIQGIMSLIDIQNTQTTENEIKEYLQIYRKHFLKIKNSIGFFIYSLEKIDTIYFKSAYKLKEFDFFDCKNVKFSCFKKIKKYSIDIISLINNQIDLTDSNCDYFLHDLNSYLTQTIDLIGKIVQEGIIFEFTDESKNKIKNRNVYFKYFPFNKHFMDLIDRSFNENEFDNENESVFLAIKQVYFSQLLELFDKVEQITKLMIESIDPLRMLPSRNIFGQEITPISFIKDFKRNLTILIDTTLRIKIFRNQKIYAFKMRKNLICEPIEYFTKHFFGPSWDSLFGNLIRNEFRSNFSYF